jgi:D-alanyl-lipoteichoic acid acyltransferase DltB (MBOAT superfamily)
VIFGLLQGVAMSGEMLTQKWRNRRLKGIPMTWQKWAGWTYTMFYFAMTEVVFRAKSLDEAKRAYLHLMIPTLPHSAAELFAYKGALYLMLDCVAIALWIALSTFVYKAINNGTHYFLFVTVLLILVLGRLSTGRFIYAAF